MKGLRIGHATNLEKGTGVSIFLFDPPGTGAYFLCGGGAATHELAPLHPDNSVPMVHAIMLAGGSTYGLFAAEGVVRYLTERHIGLPVPHGVVPIVPAAAIYDLADREPVPPTAEDAYQACLQAKEGMTESGLIGAGTGATVGKIIQTANWMPGGLGRAELKVGDLIVIAYAVVNAVGDIRDEANDIIAGARLANGAFADCEHYLLSGEAEVNLFEHSNTTLVALFTNAKLNKGELQRVAKMGSAGIARAIAPAFTGYDGDIVFAISLGSIAASILTIGTLAAKAVQLAIIDAVQPDKEIL